MNNFAFTILLSASVPASGRKSREYGEEYALIANAQMQIEEAVVALARNIFQHNARIIFGAHPSISPLVGSVVTEFSYNFNKDAEDLSRNEAQQKPILMYQSRAFQKVIPEETIELYSSGASDLVWTPAVDGERFDPELRGKEQCLESLAFMRKQMMENDIDALVCMGGMEGVEREFELFLKLHPNKPVYLLETTGGASSIVARYVGNYPNVKVIDTHLSENSYRAKSGAEQSFRIIPYVYISALIVEDVLNSQLGDNLRA